MAVVEPLLDVRDLVKEFPVRGERARVVHAVNTVSFQVLRGETFALIGESGSGKTTVGRCILHLTRPTRGSITFSGQELTQLSARRMRPWRARIQAVFQDPADSLNPRMRVRTIIEEVLVHCTDLNGAQRRARVAEVLELVQLDPTLSNDYPGTLSGGVQQRVAIARALAPKPDLIVLDEPTSQLDVSIRAGVVRLLKRLQEELGTAYLFISHDLTAVREVSDRIGIMYLGELVETGDADDLFAEQLHPYSRALLSSVLYPDPDQTPGAVELSDEIPSPVDLPSGCFLHPRCPFAEGPCIVQHPDLEQHGANRWVRCWRVNDIRSGAATKSTTAADVGAQSSNPSR